MQIDTQGGPISRKKYISKEPIVIIQKPAVYNNFPSITQSQQSPAKTKHNFTVSSIKPEHIIEPTTNISITKFEHNHQSSSSFINQDTAAIHTNQTIDPADSNINRTDFNHKNINKSVRRQQYTKPRKKKNKTSQTNHNTRTTLSKTDANPASTITNLQGRTGHESTK